MKVLSDKIGKKMKKIRITFRKVRRGLLQRKRYLAYLEKYPVLLPVAWGSRVLTYGRETLRSGSDAGESVRIGSKRIELLKTYGIIDR